MRKPVLLVLLALLLCGAASAQNTVVTGNVTGPNSFPWANATGHASLVCPGNAQAYIGTSPIPRDYPTVGLDGNGNFTQTLFDTSSIVDVNQAPMACNYVYSFTEQCGIASFKTNPITGVTGAGPVNITSQIAATAVNLSAQCTPSATGFFEQTVPSSGNPNFNSPGDTLFNFTLNQNVTSSIFTTSVVPGRGRVFQINICQNATGGFSMTWPSNVTLPTNYVFSTTANACSPVAFRSIDGGLTWQPWMNQNAGGGGGSSPLLQTNGAANTIQSVLNLINGFNIGLTSDLSGGVTVANTAPLQSSCGSQGTVQAANNASGCQTTALSESGGVLTNGDQNSYRGPNPSVDITNFNARALSTSAIPLTTGTITGGTNSLTVASNTGWQKNDGFALQFAGATNCGTAPVAPTGFAGLASSMPGTGHAVAGATGSTSYSYVAIGLSVGGCWTAASPILTISNGNATLGATNIPITSCVNSAGTVTCTVGSTTGLATGMWVRIGGTTDDGEFGSWHNITVLNGTQFTYGSNESSVYPMFSTTATGGTLYYFIENSIALPALPAGTNIYKEALYGCTGASCALPANAANYSLKYVSYPLNLGFIDSAYGKVDDYGSVTTVTIGQSAPWYLPSTPPATNVNDMLVTTVTNISGTTFTLAANATNTVTNTSCNGGTCSLRFDNVPAILAAEAASNTVSPGGGGSIRFPPPLSASPFGTTCYITSSYLVLNVVTNVAGPPCTGETVELSGNRTSLNGMWDDTIHSNKSSFDNQSLLTWTMTGGNPGIWRKGPQIRNLFFTTSGPGENLIFDNSTSQTLTENVHFNIPDGVGIAYHSYEATFGSVFNNTGWTNGPSQVIGAVAAPTYINRDSIQTTFNNVSGNLRGLYWECTNNPPNSCADYIMVRMANEWQGPITPIVTVNNTTGGRYGWIWLEHMIQDSGAECIFCNASNGGSQLASLIINGTNQPGTDPGGGVNQPIIGGNPIAGGVSLLTDAPLIKSVGMNHDIFQCPQSGTNQPNYRGCQLPSLNLATSFISANHTLNASEGNVVVTATATITVPHALANQTWFVYCQSGTCTLTIDSGILYGNGGTGSFVINPGSGVFVSADGINAHAGGAGGGTVASPNLSVQFNNSGVPGGIAVPTSPNNVPQTMTSTPAAGVGTVASFNLAGVVPRVTACPSNLDTILPTDRAGLVEWNDASACAVTLPQAGSGGGTNNDFTKNFVFISCDIGVGTATVTPTTSTITYLLNGIVHSAQTSMPVSTGQCAFTYSDNTNYFAVLVAASGVNQLQTNTVNNSSQVLLNLLNSSVTNGVTLTVTNTSGGIVQLGLSGTLNNSGLTNSATTVNGQTCTLGASCTIPPGSITIANASVTGTTVNTLTKLTGAPSTAVISAATDTGGAIGITTSGAGTTGSAVIQLLGSVSCVFDGATIAGDYVQISSSVTGNCHDTGAATYPASGQVVGRVLSTNGGAGTYTIDLFPSEITLSTSNKSDVLNQSTSQGTVTLATAPSVGLYRLHYYSNLNTPCTTGANTVSFTFNWTDAGNARVLTTGTLQLGAAQATNSFLEGISDVWIASGNVTYTSTVAGSCATGTSSYDIHARLEKAP